MITKFIAVMIVFGVVLNAGIYSPYIKSSSSAKIIDIGERSQFDIVDKAPKIWSQYEAMFSLIDGVIRTEQREYSQRKTCKTDELGNTACPLEARVCEIEYNYTRGTSSLAYALYEKVTDCPIGTTLNLSKQRCEAASFCAAGLIYNNTCVDNVEVYNNYRVAKTTYTTSGWGWWETTSSLTQITKCKDGALYFATNNNAFILLDTEHRGTGSYSSAPSCFKTINEHTSTQCPTNAPNKDEGVCYAGTQCDSGLKKTAWNKCVQNYSYFNYECPADSINMYDLANSGPVGNGLDCKGQCLDGRLENCVCNDELPPVDNCRTDAFVCPINRSLPCVENSSTALKKRPIEIKELSGDELSPNANGVYIQSECGANCEKGIRKISGAGEFLCFDKGDGDKSCVQVKGCEFDGLIDSGANNLGSIWTNEKSISAMDITGVQNSSTITSTCTLNGSIGYKGRIQAITSYKMNLDQIDFWNPYEKEGYLGFIEVVRDVSDKDKTDGYIIDTDIAKQIQNSGFNRIETYSGKTYAISDSGMSRERCAVEAAKFGFQMYPNINGIPVDGRYPYDLVMNATGGFYNDNTNIFTKEVVGVCSAGFTPDLITGRCYIQASKSVPFSGESCTDAGGYMSLVGSATSKQIKFNNVPSAHNCGKSTGVVMQNIGLPANAVIQSQSYTYATSGSGCDDRSGTVAEGVHGVSYCPSGGAQTVSISGTLNYVYKITQEEFCPAETLSRSGVYCTVPYSLNLNRKCVIVKEDSPRDFKIAKNAIKNSDANATSFFCSNLTCDGSNSCQYLKCTDDYRGDVISSERPTPAPNECTDELCDANLATYNWCGKNGGCPTEQAGFQSVGEHCYKTVCTEGGFDPNTGECFKWQCPEDYVDTGASCVKK